MVSRVFPQPQRTTYTNRHRDHRRLPLRPFHTDLSKIVNDTISIYPEMLAAWTVTAELLISYEHAILPESP